MRSGVLQQLLIEIYKHIGQYQDMVQHLVNVRNINVLKCFQLPRYPTNIYTIHTSQK